MYFTINDLLCFDDFKNMRLIAGAKGTQNRVSGCGILDYELESSLKGKYLHSNFLPDQIILTSLFFAKNNPFLIGDSIKHLISRGSSGLIIKNVFNLPIHNSAIRYAEAKNFPIFLMDDMHVYFEDLIIQIDRCIQATVSFDAAEEQLSRLLYDSLDIFEKKKTARQLLPTIRDQYAVISIQSAEPVSDSLLQKLMSQAKNTLPQEISHRLFRFGKGIILLVSQDVLTLDRCYPVIQTLREPLVHPAIGISEIHYTLESINYAIQQAVHAAVIHHLEQNSSAADKKPFLQYHEIGIYRILLPMLDQESIHQYSSDVLEPLLEFDVENRGSLTQSLIDLVRFDGNLHLLAQHSGQHENTLRNRFDKVRMLTGLNYRNPAQYAELSLAVQIYLLEHNNM